MQAEALQYFSLHTDTTPPQPNHTVAPNTHQTRAIQVLQPAYGYHITPAAPHRSTSTRIEPEQYNPLNNSTNKSQAPEDECTNIRNMLSIK